MHRRGWIAWMGLTLACAPAAGCSVGDIAGNLAGSAAGGNVGELARAAVGGAEDLTKQVSTRFSPAQEYALGRAAAAEVLGRYGVDPDETRQEYVRRIGATIVALSTRLTGTHGGYHFAVLDTDTANGVSAPGGFVFITRGAFVRCEDEDEVAAILAHELAHVSLKHGEGVIVRGRQNAPFLSAVGRMAGAAAGGGGVRPDLSGLLADQGRTLGLEIADTGYGRDAEFEADREAALILYDVGYDANAMRTYLEATATRSTETWVTHPPAAQRIATLQPILASYGGPFSQADVDGKAARTARFQRVLAGGPIDVEGETPLETEVARADIATPPTDVTPAEIEQAARGTPPEPTDE